MEVAIQIVVILRKDKHGTSDGNQICVHYYADLRNPISEDLGIGKVTEE